MKFYRILMFSMLCLLVLGTGHIFAQSSVTTKDLNVFSWRHIGPWTFSGRITDFAVPSGQSQIYYVATASGGVWKTEDGGISFVPIFDQYGTTSLRTFMAMTTSSSAALPARSPRPFIVHSICLAPARTPASELATASPRSL